MAEEINRSDVIARRFALVEEIAIVAGRHKAELAPLADELGLCEKFIHASMAEAGEQQVKTEAGMAFFTTQDSVTVENMDGVITTILAAAEEPEGFGTSFYTWAEALAHVKATGLWGLLNKAVNKTAAKELIEAQTPPAGVKYEARKVLAWRRGK